MVVEEKFMKKTSFFLLVSLFACLLFSCKQPYEKKQSYEKKENLLLGTWDSYTLIEGKSLYLKATFKENTFSLYDPRILGGNTGVTIFHTYTTQGDIIHAKVTGIQRDGSDKIMPPPIDKTADVSYSIKDDILTLNYEPVTYILHKR